jgi:predicted component of type VI protein secretion system
MAREVRVHHLALGETSIGAAESCDLVLDDTSELQAVVTRTDDDEYVIGARGRATPTFVNGRELPVQTLRTGARIEVGPWRLTYVRDEFADHGRPFGGRRDRPAAPPGAAAVPALTRRRRRTTGRPRAPR